MNRHNVLSLSVITALGLALLPGSAAAQQKSMKEQLVGTWTIVSWEQDGGPTGSKFQRFGATPKGYNIFDASGRFYIMLSGADLPQIASNNSSTSTPKEARAIAGGTVGYFGTYTVDETAKIITLHIDVSSLPSQAGSDQKRTITSLTGDELKYQNTTALSGGQIHYVWKRDK